ncbi:hypothetical protein BH18ACI2_BH18ACI2_08090 [soil metagenome]
MLRVRTINRCLWLLLIAAVSVAAAGQGGKPGGIKGKVVAPEGLSGADVKIIVRQDETEVARGETDRKGRFEIRGIMPGRYSVVFRKPGLSVAELKDVDVEAGKVHTIRGGTLSIPIDEGTLAFLRGSVFNAAGRSLPGVKIELALIGPDGAPKKIDGRLTSETGAFSFRLKPEPARYRVTAKMNGMQAATQEVSVEGAAVYRIALTLKPDAP